MLAELQFVKGAVAKKNFDPTLTHFLIRERRVWGFNGIIGLSSPIQCDLDIAPQGLQFLRALAACKETITLHLTDKGQLCVSSGGFRTLVECVKPEEHKALPPAGDFVELPGNMLNAIKTLEPFIGFDASRPWACGILFRGRSAYATNNIIATEYWLGHEFPITVNIPVQAVRELMRIGEEPLGLQVNEDRLTFYYSGHRWLMTKLSALTWPDITAALDHNASDQMIPPPEGLFEALDIIAPFTDDMGRVTFDGSRITTGDSADATAVEFEGCPASGSYNCDQLLALKSVAHRVDFAAYPRPVPFVGHNLRGVVLGLR